MGAVAPPVPVAPTAAGADGGRRRIFSVELPARGDRETTIVSWKKLLKEAGLAASLPPSVPASAAVQPVVESLTGPVCCGTSHRKRPK